MAIVERKKQTKIEIDLNGPEGNVFVLMGITKRLMSQYNKLCDLTPEDEDYKCYQEYQTNIRALGSKGYQYAVETLDAHFTHQIIIYK